MLPPLNLADAKRDFFSPRKRSHVRRSTIGASNATGIAVSPQHRPGGLIDATPAIPETSRTDGDVSSSGSALVASLTLIPREFFVVERNSVLPSVQYPPSIYQSSFSSSEGGLWETIVFPALAPQTRQQVLYLRQTLEKLRDALLRASATEEACPSSPTAPSGSPRRRDRVQHAVVEFSKQEARIYSVSFHELTRQVKFICKEQSELLCEVRERYDAIINRLADRIQQLGDERSLQEERIKTLTSEVDDLRHVNAALKRANARQTEVIKDLELHPSTRVDSDGDQSEEADDEEAQEAEWQRQRRELASVDMVTSTKKRRDSVAEENLAAARVQTAFHKFQMRKAQHALALRVEKNVAALDIQRSYRGFRGRQHTLHHRAVMQTIMTRRQQVAAVELLQENVRAYLHKRRRSVAERRRSAITRVTEIAAGGGSVESVATAGPVVELASELPPLPDTPESVGEAAWQSVAAGEAHPSRELLRRILTTSSELMTAVKQLQSRAQRGGAVSYEVQPSGSAMPRTEVESVSVDEPADASSPALLPSEEEETKLLWRTLQQARSLVLSLEEAIDAGRTSSMSTSGTGINTGGPLLTPQGAESDGHEAGGMVSVGVSTSTTSLDNLDAAQTQADEELATTTQDSEAEALTKAATPLPKQDSESLSSDGGVENDRLDSRFHLDDSLWRSSTYYAAPDHTRDTPRQQQQQQQFLALLSSREQRKRFVQLKQFISDVYDTIVGRMRELPPPHLADAIKSGASLALSCDEWQRQRQAVLLNAAGDPSANGLLSSVIPSDIQAMSREHFRCQLGLNNLVEAAMQDLLAAADCFSPVDPDVDAFRGFLTHERLPDELEFRCVCRYLCAQGGGSSLSSTKQPVFHPSTMREVLPIASALRLARLLFRVDAQDALTASDARYVEVENAVYRQYLPMSGFQQCEEIVSRYFPAVEDVVTSPPTASPPVASPRASLSALTRPTNCSQFHAKQFNSTASRSPLVRRPHQQQAASQRLLSLSQSGDVDMDGGKWIYFDDLVALLLKYRAEMHSFHLFLQWTVELFALSADAGAGPVEGASASVPFMSERAFAQVLAPMSLGPRDRELRNLFHNALRQRYLRLCMPLRTFTSVVLLLLENRMISVSKYAAVNKPRRARTDELRALLDTYAPGDSAAPHGEGYARAWRVLARQWRAREAAFEDAVETLVHVGGDDGLRHALRLLQLRNELLDLLATRPATALLRGFEVYEELVDGVEPRGETQVDRVEPVADANEGEDDGQEDGDEEGQVDWPSEAESDRGESPWPADAQQT